MSGLPGTGKSTIAKAFATQFAAVYVRVDEIENVVRGGLPSTDFGPLGYLIGALQSLAPIWLWGSS